MAAPLVAGVAALIAIAAGAWHFLGASPAPPVCAAAGPAVARADTASDSAIATATIALEYGRLTTTGVKSACLCIMDGIAASGGPKDVWWVRRGPG